MVAQAVMWVGLPDPRTTQESLQIFSDANEQVLRERHQAIAKYDHSDRGIVISTLLVSLYGDGRAQ